ncbi:hypothetical protein [Novosphingobium sp.]
MTRPLAIIGAVTLFWMAGVAKPTFGAVALAAFLTGYATARMQRD